MGHDTSSLVGKSAVIVVVVSIVAAAVDMVFAHWLHVEALGLLGFGVFCIAYATIMTRAADTTESAETAATVPASSPTTRDGRPTIVRQVVSQRVLASDAVHRPTHALTIDLEDYFHTEVASQGVSPAEWEQQHSRIEASTHRLLDLLDKNQTHATFFVLGWVALRYRSLIQEIHKRGHEIGCHSMDHQLVSRMTPIDFYESTRSAKNLIESIIEEEIVGYRAPCFSITPGCDWAFDALARLGFRYDSSVHPVDHPTYGNPTAPRTPYAVAQGRLMEFPIATWKMGGRNMSIGGGAYLRLLPYQYVHRGLTAWEKEMNSPAMLYLHPWEIDPYQPLIPLSLKSTIRQTWGTTTMERKLQRLMDEYRFAPVRDVHLNLLAGLNAISRKPSFQSTEQVAQVAG